MADKDDEDGRNASGTIACLRCRVRKIKCDRGFPKCGSCEKFGHACLTKDPSSGRVVPRSYLQHLEKRVKELEHELAQRTSQSVSTMYSDESDQTYLGGTAGLTFAQIMNSLLHQRLALEGKAFPACLADQMGPMTVPGPEEDESKSTNSSSSSKSASSSEFPHQGPPSTSSESSSEVPSIDLPPKRVAERYLSAYFTRSNPQIPVLHREQYIRDYFEPIYGPISPGVNLANKHTSLNLSTRDGEPPAGTFYHLLKDANGTLSAVPEPRIRTCLYFIFQAMAIGAACVFQQLMAEGRNSSTECHKLHKSAMRYYGYTINSPDRFLALQALLLLGVYSLMRPAHPGVWFVVGTAMWMCIEMGLHNEQRMFATTPAIARSSDPLKVDMGRRLFWCTYILDRQISMYLGRPVSLGDEYVRVSLFSIADDAWLVSGKPFDKAPDRPSYKWITWHMLGVRRIQHKIKYYFYDRADAEQASNDEESVSRMRAAMRTELDEWYHAIPRTSDVFNMDLNFVFFDLNYHQTVLFMYGVSRANPRPSEKSMRIILSAGIKILETYIRISAARSLNYSWVSTHNIFQAAASCLYVLHQTSSLNGQFKLEPFEELIRSALEVIDELKTECHTAQSCYDSLLLMSKLTMELLRRDGSAKLPGADPLQEENQLHASMPPSNPAPVVDSDRSLPIPAGPAGVAMGPMAATASNGNANIPFHEPFKSENATGPPPPVPDAHMGMRLPPPKRPRRSDTMNVTPLMAAAAMRPDQSIRGNDPLAAAPQSSSAPIGGRWFNRSGTMQRDDHYLPPYARMQHSPSHIAPNNTPGMYGTSPKALTDAATSTPATPTLDNPEVGRADQSYDFAYKPTGVPAGLAQSLVPVVPHAQQYAKQPYMVAPYPAAVAQQLTGTRGSYSPAIQEPVSAVEQTQGTTTSAGADEAANDSEEPAHVFEYFNEMSQMLIWDSLLLPNSTL